VAHSTRSMQHSARGTHANTPQTNLQLGLFSVLAEHGARQIHHVPLWSNTATVLPWLPWSQMCSACLRNIRDKGSQGSMVAVFDKHTEPRTARQAHTQHGAQLSSRCQETLSLDPRLCEKPGADALAYAFTEPQGKQKLTW
jgi:hypothetical protein